MLLVGCGSFWLVPLLFLPLVRRVPSVRELVCVIVFVGIGLLLEVWMFLHYLAPLIAVCIALNCVVLSRIAKMRSTPRAGAIMAAVLAILSLASAVSRTFEATTGVAQDL